MLYYFSRVIPWRLTLSAEVLEHCKFSLHRWCKMEQTDRSELLAHKIQTLGNRPKERIQHVTYCKLRGYCNILLVSCVLEI